MRALAILLALTLTAPVAAQSPETVRCFDSERVLPAGVYWADIGWYELHLDCPRPTVAVVAALSTRAPVLERAARAARATVIAPGYPWVVHARTAGLDADGVAVVLGQFAERADAERWMAAHRVSARLVPVLPMSEALARAHVDASPPIPEVTHVTAPAPVPAYDARDLRAIERTWTDTYAEDPDSQAHRRRRAARLARLTPACRVAPDRVFVIPALARSSRLDSRAWRPVRCGRRVAWIALEATQTDAVAWTDRSGASFITQVALVACDVPTHRTWRIAAQRRRASPSAAGGGC